MQIAKEKILSSKAEYLVVGATYLIALVASVSLGLATRAGVRAMVVGEGSRAPGCVVVARQTLYDGPILGGPKPVTSDVVKCTPGAQQATVTFGAAVPSGVGILGTAPSSITTAHKEVKEDVALAKAARSAAKKTVTKTTTTGSTNKKTAPKVKPSSSNSKQSPSPSTSTPGQTSSGSSASGQGSSSGPNSSNSSNSSNSGAPVVVVSGGPTHPQNVQAASSYRPIQPSAQALTNTGPGHVLGLFIGSSLAGYLSHKLISRRKSVLA